MKKLSEMNKPEEWFKFKVPPGTSELLAYVSDYEELHKNEIDKFRELLKEIPTNHIEFQRYSKKYGDKMIKWCVPLSLKLAAQRYFDYIVRGIKWK